MFSHITQKMSSKKVSRIFQKRAECTVLLTYFFLMKILKKSTFHRIWNWYGSNISSHFDQKIQTMFYSHRGRIFFPAAEEPFGRSGLIILTRVGNTDDALVITIVGLSHLKCAMEWTVVRFYYHDKRKTKREERQIINRTVFGWMWWNLGICRYMYILYRSLINVVSDVVFDIVVPYHT